MKYTFQHFVDIQTSASSLTLMQIQAGGKYTLDRIKHLFPAYKYIKLGRVSVKLLPASTLPVDPLGLSYDDTDPQTIDPRDQMNPGLVRITNGEDIFTDFTGLSDTAMEQMYINTMLDPRWSKFMLQSGFKRSAVPLYWTVGQLHQDPYPGSVINVPDSNANGIVGRTSSFYMYDSPNSTDNTYGDVAAIKDRAWSDPRGLFQTGHRGRMGWMPTDAFYTTYDRSNFSESVNLVESEFQQPMVQPLPEVNVITCLFPKAYKTIYYYRMFITETVYLSGLKNTGINDDNRYEYRAIDNFIRVPNIYPADPSAGLQDGMFQSTYSGKPDPLNTGGGDQ